MKLFKAGYRVTIEMRWIPAALCSLGLVFCSSSAPAQNSPEPTGTPSSSVSEQELAKWNAARKKGETVRAYPDGSPIVKGKAAILIDPRSGKVMWERNSRERLPIASLTKVMTALLILESGRLEETVTASKNANQTPYASIYLAYGEKVKLRDILWGIMLRSGNDACVAAAEHLYGSVPKFIDRMNQRAKELGMNDTHFVTVNGLHDPDHYSTAADMATVTLEALKYPLFAEMAGTKKHQIERSIRKMNALFYNRSRILSRWELADGIKTGYTRQAGHCFIGSATMDGWKLVSVILKSPQVYEDTRNLLEYGFQEYRSELLAKAGAPVVQQDVIGGRVLQVPLGPWKDVYTVVKKGHVEPLQASLTEKPEIHAPLDQGTRVAQAFWGPRDQPLAVAELMALSAVEEAPIRVAARAVSMWWPMGLLVLTLGAIRYGATSKNHRQRRNRRPKRGGNVGGGRSSVRQRSNGATRRPGRP